MYSFEVDKRTFYDESPFKPQNKTIKKGNWNLTLMT